MYSFCHYQGCGEVWTDDIWHVTEWQWNKSDPQCNTSTSFPTIYLYSRKLHLKWKYQRRGKPLIPDCKLNRFCLIIKSGRDWLVIHQTHFFTILNTQLEYIFQPSLKLGVAIDYEHKLHFQSWFIKTSHTWLSMPFLLLPTWQRRA